MIFRNSRPSSSPGVTVHKGFRYGGENQRATYENGRDPAKIEDRAKKFVPPSQRPARRSPEEVKEMIAAREKMKAAAPVDIRNIVWRRDSSLATFLVNCSELKRIVKHRIDYYPSQSDPFYAVLLDKLEHEKFDRLARFHVRAFGNYSREGDDESLTFIKVFAEGDEFILLDSFLTDCGESFLKDLS